MPSARALGHGAVAHHGRVRPLPAVGHQLDADDGHQQDQPAVPEHPAERAVAGHLAAA